MNKETELQNAILIAISEMEGCVFWRNNTGSYQAYDRKSKRFWQGAWWVRLLKQWVTYGLAKGSSDIIGIVKGRFVALEVKTGKGVLSDDQKLFFALVRRYGGYASEVFSVEQAKECVIEARRGLDRA